MTPQDIRDLVYLSYKAYERGDRAFVLDLFHDDIEWRFFSPPEALPIPNQVKGKGPVLAALKKIDEAVETVRNELELVMVDGDRAAVICDYTVRQRASGRIMRYKMAAFHRYSGGKLIEYSAFADGFDLVQQALGRVIEVPEAYPR